MLETLDFLGLVCSYSIMVATRPEATVRPPSRFLVYDIEVIWNGFWDF